MKLIDIDESSVSIDGMMVSRIYTRNLCHSCHCIQLFEKKNKQKQKQNYNTPSRSHPEQTVTVGLHFGGKLQVFFYSMDSRKGWRI